MSRRYRRVMRRLYVSSAAYVIAFVSAGVGIGATLTKAGWSNDTVALFALIGCGLGCVAAPFMRPKAEDVRSVTEDER